MLVDLEGARPVSDAMLAALVQAGRPLAARDGRLLVASEHAAARDALERAGLELVESSSRQAASVTRADGRRTCGGIG